MSNLALANVLPIIIYAESNVTLYEAHAMLKVNLFCAMEISTEPDVQVITQKCNDWQKTK